MKKLLSAVLAFGWLPFLLPAAGDNTALLVRDSILDPEAHYFPWITYAVPTVHGVTFQQEGVLTHEGWQYAAYYDAAGHVSLGRRLLPDGEWETFSLTDYTFTEVNSHNSVVLGICTGDGTIHLSFDHHNHPLKYRVSVPGVVDHPEAVEWGPALFGPIRNRLADAAISGLTYPRFISSPDGKLLFTYRTGGSGNGDDVLYEYDGATGEWTRIGIYISREGFYSGTFTSSSTSRNAYQDNTVFDRDGRLHITWCWRETPDPRSNHDLYYAYSDDKGRTWKNQAGVEAGVTGATPLRVDTPGLLAWEIPQNRNYINNSGMTVDAAGRVHVMAWHYPDSVPDQTYAFDERITAKSRFHHYWRDEDGVWRRNPTGLTGSRSKMIADEDGHLFIIYGDAENLQIAIATPVAEWADWQEMDLTGALPAGMGAEVNAIYDPVRWQGDRVLSIYAQERTNSGGAPKPLHVLDYHVSRTAVLPAPADNATLAPLDGALEWTPGRGAVVHDIYFGTNREAVEAATPESPEFLGRTTLAGHEVEGLEQESWYYWRVDAVDADENVARGRVWAFETVSFRPRAVTGTAFRGYGGRATFEGALVSAAGIPAEVILYWGASDGGTDAGAWSYSVSLGERTEGPLSIEKSGLGEETVYFRFFASNEHGSEWSPAAGELPEWEDLAHWKKTAEIAIDFGEEMEPLIRLPVLVRLDAEELEGFSHAQFLSPSYGDLRFSDVSGNELLPFEVERWNPAGTSYVWVRVPEIEGPTRIRAWWGREGRQPPSRPEQAAVWSERFAGVWHLDEDLGFGLDSSPHTGVSSATAVSAANIAVVPGAASFDGSSSAIRIENSAALNPSHITIEAWIRTTQSGIASIVGKDRTTAGGGRVWQFRIVDGKLEIIVFNGGTHHSLVGSETVADGEWRHVAGTWDGEVVRLYVDGQLDAESAFSGALRSGQGNDAFIGRMETQNPGYYLGDIDEVRISNIARSEDWIRASWLNQRPEADEVVVGSPVAADLDDDLLPDAWEMEHFGSVGIADGRGGSDTNGNGVPDLLAFATGVDPLAPDGFPFAEIEPMGFGFAPMFTYDQIAGGSGKVGTDYTAAGLRYVAEFSRDLAEWYSGADYVEFTGSRQQLPGGMERVTVRFLGDIGEETNRLFARVRVAVE